MRFHGMRDHVSMSDRMCGPQDGCDHSDLTDIEQLEGSYRAWCAVCGKAGPARKTPEAARKALLVLGARDGATMTRTCPDARTMCRARRGPLG